MTLRSILTRLTALALAATMLTSAPASAQPAAPPADWTAWAALTGEWVADPGAPGGATGGFSFAPELQGRVLVRHNHADYPAAAGRAAARHEDLLIVYQAAGATRADYYDNEGHVIRYAVTVDKGRFVFLSDPVAGQPRFRLTYVIEKPGALALRFEIAPPGSPDAWKPYITATAHKK